MIRGTKVDIDVIIHATERADTVLDAVEETLHARPDACTKTEGHFGNEILMYAAHTRKSEAQKVLGALYAPMRWHDKESVADDLASISDALYIRIDKQKLIGGVIARETRGAIRVRISVPVYSTDVSDTYARLFADMS